MAAYVAPAPVAKASNYNAVVFDPDVALLSGDHTRGQSFSPAYVVVLGVLLATIVLVIYYYCFVIHFNTTLCFISREQSSQRRRIAARGGQMYSNGAFVTDTEDDGAQLDVGAPETVANIYDETSTSSSNASAAAAGTLATVASSKCKKGLDEMAIRSIPVYRYRSKASKPGGDTCTVVVLMEKVGKRESSSDSEAEEDEVDEKSMQHHVPWTDCAVCLGSFREADMLRLLPACNHTFHVACVDTWLASSEECPLCRTRVVPPNCNIGVDGGRSH